MKRIVTMMLMLLLVGGATQVQAQSWLKKLGKKVEEKAKSKVEEKAEKAVDKAFDKAEDAVTGKGKEKKDNNAAADAGDNTDAGGQEVAQNGGQQQKKSAEMSWNKFDFVSGDEIIFEDNLAGEQLGEFPSQWDMIKGNVEVAQMDGENVIALIKAAGITPLMKTPKNYLPDIFTIEFDFYKSNDINGIYNFYIKDEKGKEIVNIENWGRANGDVFANGFNTDISSTNGERRSIRETVAFTPGWHRISISFNQRALKIYVDEQRVVNAPNVAQGGWFSIETSPNGGREAWTFYIRNVRIAKGAVPLYDRMMSDGKFITYGITFDVGKSTIKPESMGEINRIVQLMTENPDLKFSVEGHTDSTGNASSNQTLSEARSAAIVAKLVELGISADRLTSSGKGQNNPIADNATDEGRAKNRRVEFVKQ